MTKQQMEWAAQHDWFAWATHQGLNCYVVSVLTAHSDGRILLSQHSDYAHLRAWAGY